MPTERKVPLGCAEADALADWLEITARDYEAIIGRVEDGFPSHYCERVANEARDWAERVRPVKVKQR